MPLLVNGEYREPKFSSHAVADAVNNSSSAPVSASVNGQASAGSSGPAPRPVRRQSQHSNVAKTAIMSTQRSNASSGDNSAQTSEEEDAKGGVAANDAKAAPTSAQMGRSMSVVGDAGRALSDTPATTPATTAPNSPIILPRRQNSGTITPAGRHRAATTLDIPGLTKSKASPDGKISQRDVGSKLVIVMVGLPARGKSYITKKLARYLNWLQHDTKIFNVGEKRRVVAGGSMKPPSAPSKRSSKPLSPREVLSLDGVVQEKAMLTPPSSPSTQLLVNGELPPQTPPLDKLPMSIFEALKQDSHEAEHGGNSEPPVRPSGLEHGASFFDPNNEHAAQLRERVAMETLDDLLDFILEKRGSVGIFDATNSTLERRQTIVEKIRSRAGNDLGILFLESVCIDETLLESNMRLKLSGPDYRDQDPVTALEDFKKRVSMYESKYIPLGDYEERNGMSYIKIVDVGRKIISHQIRGFLSAQTNYYLLNFNLAPRQIWVTRHGESQDNIQGKIGGDSDLTINGRAYAKALTDFIIEERKLWDIHQQDKAASTHFPPQAGDSTPPNPTYELHELDTHTGMNFCVWTSMLKRSIQTAQYFDEEDFDVKQMKMLDELNAGIMEGLTYEEIRNKYASEYNLRKHDKMHYRYPGPGGEGYLDIINRLRPVIHEVERMTDHVLLVGHRSVARVLLAYFMGLNREDVADLDVPLGMLYMLEPKPYGVEFKAYRYDSKKEWFNLVPGYQLQRAAHQTAY